MGGVHWRYWQVLEYVGSQKAKETLDVLDVLEILFDLKW